MALTENFRTTVPIIEWVNAVFARLIGTGPPLDTAASHLVQPGYVPLVGRRPAAANGPSVTLLGRHAHGDEIDAAGLRDLEATDVAAAIATAVVDRWTVEGTDGRPRPCGFGGIASVAATYNVTSGASPAEREAPIP